MLVFGVGNVYRFWTPKGGPPQYVIGVTGQHEVLMVGLYTRDPAEVGMNYNSLC